MRNTAGIVPLGLHSVISSSVCSLDERLLSYLSPKSIWYFRLSRQRRLLPTDWQIKDSSFMIWCNLVDVRRKQEFLECKHTALNIWKALVLLGLAWAVFGSGLLGDAAAVLDPTELLCFALLHSFCSTCFNVVRIICSGLKWMFCKLLLVCAYLHVLSLLFWGFTAWLPTCEFHVSSAFLSSLDRVNLNPWHVFHKCTSIVVWFQVCRCRYRLSCEHKTCTADSNNVKPMVNNPSGIIGDLSNVGAASTFVNG